MKASWSEMLDNSINKGATVKLENDIFRERIVSASQAEEREGGGGDCFDLLQLLLRFCLQEEFQLVISYMLISLAAALLLPATYWVVLRIYSQL